MPTKEFLPTQPLDNFYQQNGLLGIGWVYCGYRNDWTRRFGSRLRFPNVTIPKDATIISAYLKLTARQTLIVTTVRSALLVENVDNAPTGQYPESWYTNRRDTMCLAPLYWDNIPAWTENSQYSSIDMKDRIQQVIDRPGWASGNGLAVFWTDHQDRSSHIDGAYRSAISYTRANFLGNPALAPTLVINYEVKVPKGTLIVHAVADSEEVTASVLVGSAGPYDTPLRRDLDPNGYTINGSYKSQTQIESVTIQEGETETVTLRFKKYHKVTIISDPSPINFTFDSEAVKTPFVRDDVEAGTYTVELPASVMVGVDEYLFQQWEDGTVDPKRTVTIGSPQAVNLTATYRLKQIEGTGPITQLEHKDNLRQVFGGEKDIDEDNPLPVSITAVDLSPTNPLPTDPIDRWLRQLGLIDLSRVLGAPLTAANPVITGIYDAAGNRMPSMDAVARAGFVDVIDRAARLLGIVYGDLGQLLQVVPADALAVANSLRTAGFLHVYDPVADDWNRLREGAAIGQALVDTADRWARQLGLIDLSRVLGAPLTAANPVITGIYDAAANRMPAMDAVARPGFVDAIDRAARLLGVVYGSQAAQLQQVVGTLELITQDTGLNTNPERWLHDNHWEQREVTIAAAGVGGEQNLGGVVGAGLTLRIRTLIIRHAGTNNTVVTVLVSGGATVITFDLAPQTTRVVSAQDGWAFVNPEQPAVQSSDVTGGNTFVSTVGVEV